MQHPRKTMVAVATASLVAAAFGAAGMASASPTNGASGTAGRTVVAGTGPAGMSVRTTQLGDNARVGVSVFVGRDRAGLQAAALAISNPSSTQYQHFLSAAQVKAQFGATAAQQSAVAGWLHAAGMTVTHHDAFVVSATGTAAGAEKALQAPLEHIVGAAGTTQVVAGHDVSVPSSLGAVVSTVTLRGATAVMPHHQALPASHGVIPGSAQATAVTQKCSAYYGQKKAKGTPAAYGKVQTWAVCGYLPSQVRDAYGVTASGDTGKGVTVGILSGDNDSTAEADADKWATNRGEPTFKKHQYTTIVAPGSPNGVGDVESALDVEAVHGMAPDANVVYSVGSGSVTGDGLLDGFAQMVTADAADVITSSWYDGYIGQVPQSLITAWEGYLDQATTQGISVNFATGDYSDTTPLQYPGSDPEITTIGGTSLAVGKNGKNLWEAPWATDETGLSSDGTAWQPAPPGSYAEGGTGGISTVFAEPSWQKGVVPKSMDPKKMRAVPDVSALGDWNLGYQIGYTSGGSYREAVNGGTSLSSPLFAGMEADAIQDNGGTNLGFANPTFYSLYGSKAFHDVVQDPLGKKTTLAVVYGPSYGQATTLSSMAQCQSTRALTCGKGYDTVAGVGSPTATFFSSFGS